MTAAIDAFDDALTWVRTADEDIAAWAGDRNETAGWAALHAVDEVIERMREVRGLLAVELSGAVIELPDQPEV